MGELRRDFRRNGSIKSSRGELNSRANGHRCTFLVRGIHRRRDGTRNAAEDYHVATRPPVG
jgi:hypothetical protein